MSPRGLPISGWRANLKQGLSWREEDFWPASISCRERVSQLAPDPKRAPNRDYLRNSDLLLFMLESRLFPDCRLSGSYRAWLFRRSGLPIQGLDSDPRKGVLP